MMKSEIRGDDYRAKADGALSMAAAATLVQVRVRHEAAAAVWMGLAAFEDRRSAHARTLGGAESRPSRPPAAGAPPRSA